MLRISGLTKRYRTGDLALKGIDLVVPDGQVMALIGPSGAGKSTVIRCVNRLVEPTSGSIELNGVDIVKLGSGELRRARRRMGMIFQEYALVERLSVMENVLTGRLGYVGFWQSWLRRFPQSDIDEAFRLLERVGLDHIADKRADELSGGQRQRVGICRALIQNPELLLVDEPTASLDPKTSRQIMRLIKELCSERKLSAIINIHDVMLAQMFAERIVGLRQGEIVYDGPPDKLTPAVLTSIYGEEDWSATIRKVDEEAPDDEAGNVVPFDTPRLDRDRMAGLTLCWLKRVIAHDPCHCRRAAPLEEAAADQIGLAALDPDRGCCCLFGAGRSDDARQLDPRLGRATARRRVCRCIFPARLRQQVARDCRRNFREPLDDGCLDGSRYRTFDTGWYWGCEKHCACAGLLLLSCGTRGIAQFPGSHSRDFFRQALRVRTVRRLRHTFLCDHWLLRKIARRRYRGYGSNTGRGRARFRSGLAAVDQLWRSASGDAANGRPWPLPVRHQ